jgi:hypothetical protein
LLTAKKKDAMPEIKSLEDYEPYKVLRDRLNGLRAQARAAQTKLDDLTVLLAEHRSHIRQRAELLSDGLAVPEDDRQTLESRVRATQDDVATLLEAVSLCENKLRAAQQQASCEICEQRAPAHRAAVLRIVKALAELAEANSQEAAIRDEIERAGANCSLPFASFPGVGDCRDSSSAVSHYIFGLADSGLIPRSHPFAQDLAKLQGRR